jgi:hypothetical protein
MTNTPRTLILTGWGWKDYAFAAALALRHCKEAGLLGVSVRRLPEFLGEVKGHREILILGVGLGDNPGLLEKALARLAADKVKVTWISSLPLSKAVSDVIRGKLECRVEEEADGITDAVGRAFRIPADDLAQLLREKKPTTKAKSVHLLAGRGHVHESNYQNEAGLPNAIRHVAAGDDESQWTPAEQKMVAHYLRFGSRNWWERATPSKTCLDHQPDCAKGARPGSDPWRDGGPQETVALLIHNKSPRKDQPFIAFNCARRPAGPAGKSLSLGYEKGAFTAQLSVGMGNLNRPMWKTLFLDEIGELPLAPKVFLLRVLRRWPFCPAGRQGRGGSRCAPDCGYPSRLGRHGTGGESFGKTCFHRLNVIQIRIPPLREHREDVAQIANGYWLKQHGRVWSRNRSSLDGLRLIRQRAGAVQPAGARQRDGGKGFRQAVGRAPAETASLAPRAKLNIPTT